MISILPDIMTGIICSHCACSREENKPVVVFDIDLARDWFGEKQKLNNRVLHTTESARRHTTGTTVVKFQDIAIALSCD